ncbi:MAG: hypothetical protein ACSW8J_09380 [bacterium]
MQLNSHSRPAAALDRMAKVTSLLFRAARVRVEFTRDGWEQLMKLYPTPITALIQSVNIKADLGLYIASYEEKNIHLDTECQEICYRPGLFLIIRKEHGVWYITDVITTGMVAADYAPVFFWTRIKRGCNVLAARVLICWRRLTKPAQRNTSTFTGGTLYA